VSEPKHEAVAAILTARENLDVALDRLARLPAFDPEVVSYSAHALSNYLTVVTASTELLREALAGHPDPTVLSLADGVAHATNLMTHVVSQMGRRASAGASQLLLGRVDMARLTGKACDYYRDLAARKQIRVGFHSESGNRMAVADRVAVAAVLDNLLSNAVKYSPPGSAVGVLVRSEGGRVVVEVTDQGPGIAAGDLPRLFQKGVQLGAVPTGGEPSHGFGLAVAKELVERQGGEIGCRSTPGVGSTFWFAVPAYLGGDSSAIPPPPDRDPADTVR
jgi:signal transduction histidine kinase